MGKKRKRQEPPIDKRKVRRRLDRAHAAGNLVRLRRWIPDSDLVEGFVVARSHEWVTLAKLSDTINLDGWVSLRAVDVQSVTVIPTDDCFEIKALQARGQWPVTAPPGFSNGNVVDVLTSSSDQFPMVSLFREFERPDVCWIGSVLSINDDTLALLDVNVDGGWARKPRRFDLDDLTRVDIGSGYEEALTLVAGPPPKVAASRHR